MGYSVFQKKDYKKEAKANLYIYTGLRYINSTVKAKLNRQEINLEILLGINANVIFKNWRINVKSDIGGFIASSKVFSYKIQLLAYYNIGKSTSVRFGWTDLDLKHDDIFQNERLIIHTHLSGPNLGIAFDF